MDQMLVDVGDSDVRGRRRRRAHRRAGRRRRSTADEWAAWLDTIPYEMVTRLGGRLPRVTWDVDA